jgi:hypothetical protein
MKINELKQSVYEMAKVKDTRELKEFHLDLIKGLDLRKKLSWQNIRELLINEGFNRGDDSIIFQKIKENSKQINDILSSQDLYDSKVEDWKSYAPEGTKWEDFVSNEELFLAAMEAKRKSRQELLAIANGGGTNNIIIYNR